MIDLKLTTGWQTLWLAMKIGLIFHGIFFSVFWLVRRYKRKKTPNQGEGETLELTNGD